MPHGLVIITHHNESSATYMRTHILFLPQLYCLMTSEPLQKPRIRLTSLCEPQSFARFWDARQSSPAKAITVTLQTALDIGRGALGAAADDDDRIGDGKMVLLMLEI